MLVSSVGLYSCVNSITPLSRRDFPLDLEVVVVDEPVSLVVTSEANRYKELI